MVAKLCPGEGVNLPLPRAQRISHTGNVPFDSTQGKPHSPGVKGVIGT